MSRRLLVLVGLYHLLTGAVMFLAPMSWYSATPGVTDTGPFNMHFVMDIALAFAVSGAAMIYGAARWDRTAGLCGAAWPVAHAALHIWVWIARGLPGDLVALLNLLGLQLPAWGALLLMWITFNSGEQ